jgi:capsid protein
MLDPDKESAAATKAVRAGQMTHDEMVREQGFDPEDFWREYAASLKRLDKYGIVLDSDPRKTNNGGQAQAAPAESSTPASPDKSEDDASDQEEPSGEDSAGA